MLKSLFKSKGFKRKTQRVEFSLNAPGAKHVFLVGDFNHWDITGIKMDKDWSGIWRAKLDLCAGRYEYKFIVDRDWINDPAGESVKNSLGSFNSVKKVII